MISPIFGAAAAVALASTMRASGEIVITGSRNLGFPGEREREAPR